jgi:hypothetical protein
LENSVSIVPVCTRFVKAKMQKTSKLRQVFLLVGLVGAFHGGIVLQRAMKAVEDDGVAGGCPANAWKNRWFFAVHVAKNLWRSAKKAEQHRVLPQQKRQHTGAFCLAAPPSQHCHALLMTETMPHLKRRQIETNKSQKKNLMTDSTTRPDRNHSNMFWQKSQCPAR